MNAAQARGLTEDALDSVLPAVIVEYVMLDIRNAAQTGRSAITVRLHGLPVPASPAQAEALREHLRKLGFAVTLHPDPDGGSYTTITW